MCEASMRRTALARRFFAMEGTPLRQQHASTGSLRSVGAKDATVLLAKWRTAEGPKHGLEQVPDFQRNSLSPVARGI